MTHTASLLIALLGYLSLACAFNPLIRKTKYGIVRGTFEKSQADSSIEYISFLGVPYARPPVGKLRFQNSLPPERWTGIKEANSNPEICVQFSHNFEGTDVIGSEDCLYLNVFIPKTARQNHNTLMPVMYWIHGGNFVFGSNEYNGPDYLMEKEVIVVSVAYRLNVFGFLSTLDEYASGNFGLKDQAMGLKWVQENIRNFEGDRNRVTICGESAGGASIQYHILSLKSKGLFQQAISHSGSTMSRWAHQVEPRKMVLRLAKGLGIRNTSSKELVERLQSVDYKNLLTIAFNHTTVGYYTPYYAQPFSTVIESESESAFISESTYSLLERGIFNNVSYILGYNTEEGASTYTYIKNGIVDIDDYRRNPKLLIPVALNISPNSIFAEEALQQIRAFYFQNGPTNDKVNWINYMSQEFFVRSIRKSVELMYKHIPLYYYRFSFTGSRSESYLGGVGHHEELFYLWYFRRPNMSIVETEADKLTRQRFVTLWTNYVINSNPTPKIDPFLGNVTWPKVTDASDIPFMDIGKNLTIQNNPDQEHYEFWEELFNLCGNPPYTSY